MRRRKAVDVVIRDIDGTVRVLLGVILGMGIALAINWIGGR
jgi:hypothetical protein